MKFYVLSCVISFWLHTISELTTDLEKMVYIKLYNPFTCGVM